MSLSSLGPPVASQDPLSVLMHIPPGYTLLHTEGDPKSDDWQIVLVFDFRLSEHLTVSIGFSLDGADTGGEFGDPLFLHKKMHAQSLGRPIDYARRPENKEIFEYVGRHIPVSMGLLPILRATERIKTNPDRDRKSIIDETLEEHNVLRRHAMAKRDGLM